MTYTWITPKGANVEMDITVEHITSETVSADGASVEVNCSKWAYTINSVKFNGVKTKMHTEAYVKGVSAIAIDKIGKDTLYVAIHENIYSEIHAEQNAEIARSLAVDKAYEDHYNKVKKAMSGF